MQSGCVKKIEVAEVKKMQEQLEKLELTGKDIKKLFDEAIRGQQTNFSFNETHFDDSKHRKKKYRPYAPNQNNFQLGIHGYNDESQHRGTASRAKVWWPWSSNR